MAPKLRCFSCVAFGMFENVRLCWRWHGNGCFGQIWLTRRKARPRKEQGKDGEGSAGITHGIWWPGYSRKERGNVKRWRGAASLIDDRLLVWDVAETGSGLLKLDSSQLHTSIKCNSGSRYSGFSNLWTHFQHNITKRRLSGFWTIMGIKWQRTLDSVLGCSSYNDK